MLRSMTGFGLGEAESELGFITVEVKSLNSRFFNVSVRLPQQLSSLEPMILAHVKEKNFRGQINVLIDLIPSSQNSTPKNKKVRVDIPLAEEYSKNLVELQKKLALIEPVNMNLISSLPGVITMVEQKGESEEVWAIVRSILNTALSELIRSKENEGEELLKDLKSRHDKSFELLKSIKFGLPKAIEDYKIRVKNRIKELIDDQIAIDESRIAMEAAIISEKSDISEELTLFESHLSQFEKFLFLQPPQSIGRQLDFLLQEMIRETATICSKITDVELSEKCLILKSEIDKMREQAQNVE